VQALTVSACIRAVEGSILRFRFQIESVRGWQCMPLLFIVMVYIESELGCAVSVVVIQISLLMSNPHGTVPGASWRSDAGSRLGTGYSYSI
jgi:hypothetical protein